MGTNDVQFNAKVEAFMKANPGTNREDAEKAVREQEKAALTKNLSGDANEGNFGSEGFLKEPVVQKAAMGAGALALLGAGLNKIKMPGWAKAGLMLVGGAAAVASCNKIEQDNINTFIERDIDYDKLADAIAKSNADQAQKIINTIIQQSKDIQQNNTNNASAIVEAIKNAGVDIKALVELMTANNTLLREFKEQQAADNEAFLTELTGIKLAINNVEDAIKNLPANIKAQFQGDIDYIKTALETGNASLSEINAKMSSMFALLEGMSSSLGDISTTLSEIKSLVKTQGCFNMRALSMMLQLLASINWNTFEIKNGVNEIKNKIGVLVNQNTTIMGKLDVIADNTGKTAEEQAESNRLLALIYESLEGLRADQRVQVEQLLEKVSDLADLREILELINTNVVNNTEASNTNTQRIIDAINKVGVDVIAAIKNSNKGLSALFDKVIKAINYNTFVTDKDAQAILNAIKNLKMPNNQVDLTTIEGLLKDLIQLTKDGNNTLTSIDGKMDIANATLEAILTSMPKAGEYKAQLNAILTAINNSKYDDSKVLRLLNTLVDFTKSNNDLLIKILQAIKDHKVDVNVVVEIIEDAEQNHEGVIDVETIESLFT